MPSEMILFSNFKQTQEKRHKKVDVNCFEEIGIEIQPTLTWRLSNSYATW